ncbi:MAG: hypothetical protein IJT04_07970 [Bacteroidales bacterium]|nr:hypothetical protein [Bacteroidales bacterium]
METIKKILEYIWIGICYLFKGLWIVLRFILILIWRGVVWIWDFIVTLWRTPSTASGNWDMRFKGAKKIEWKIFMLGFGIPSIVLLIIGLSVSLFKPKPSGDKDKEDSIHLVKEEVKIKKKHTKAPVEKKEMVLQDTTIDLHLITEEVFDEKQEEEANESPCKTEPIIEKNNYSPVDKEELPELPKMDLPTSNEAL